MKSFDWFIFLCVTRYAKTLFSLFGVLIVLDYLKELSKKKAQRYVSLLLREREIMKSAVREL